jgi:hypothetical protein
MLSVTAQTKLLAKILSGTSSQNISFDELVGLLQHLGFVMRISGGHRIFSREGVVEILNLQPRRDGTAKPYQLRQVRNVIVRNKLAGEDDGS